MKKSEETLKEFLIEAATLRPHQKSSSIFRKGWVSFTYLEIIQIALEVKNKILEQNLAADDKVAILLDSCPEYASAFFGAGLLKHTVVLIDARLGVKEMKHILDHSDAKVIISGFAMKKNAQELVSISENNVSLFFIDDLEPAPLTAQEAISQVSKTEGLTEEDLALLVYTSGTTSDPKGVMITWKNLVFNGRSTTTAIGAHDNATFLSILPLNHLLEFSCGMLIQFKLGSHLVYANTMLPNEILERLQAFEYTDMIVVPLFLRAMMKSIVREVSKSKIKNLYFNFAMVLSRAIPSVAFRRIIFYPVLKNLGFLKRFICGGAPLEKSTQEFFTLLGITVSQGYGLTETSPVSTVTYKGCGLFGTVGKAVPDSEVKISDSGEILIRGPHVMKGYYKRPDLTAQVIDNDGWFYSGDLGHFDAKGNLTITGRSKELVVLGNGKKVYPDEVELLITVSDNIKESIIVGAMETSGPLKDTEIVCCVIVPSDEIRALYKDEFTIRDIIELEIKKRSEGLSHYKRPTKVFLSYNELPKTSTRKNKRSMVKQMIENGAYA